MFADRVLVCRYFFFQAEDGIRDLVRSRGLGDVYKRQGLLLLFIALIFLIIWLETRNLNMLYILLITMSMVCLLYTSDAADERSSVDLGGRRIIKKKKKYITCVAISEQINIIQV